MSPDSASDLPSLLLQRTWKFSLENGPTYAQALQFMRNGRVSGYHHPNEYGWRLKDGALEFVREDGSVSCRFDEIDRTDYSIVRMRGQVVGVRPPLFHILEPGNLLWGTEHPGLTAKRKQVAVFIRTHVLNEKLYDLVECLNGSPMFDLYVLGDETSGNLDVVGVPLVSHSIALCSSLGLNVSPSNHHNVLWLCGDYPIYCAVNALPNYDYYIMLEFDVHFVRRNPLFLEGVINRLSGDRQVKLDFVSAIVVPASIDYSPGIPASRFYKEIYYSGIFSLVCLSKRAVNYLFKSRLDEGMNIGEDGLLIHCEVFAITALMNAGTFKCMGLNTLIPGCLGKTYHPGRPDFFEPNYLLGLPVDEDPRIEIVHPVLDARDYLQRLWRYHKDLGEIDVFVRHLTELPQTLVPVAVRDEFLSFVAIERGLCSGPMSPETTH